MTNPTNNNTPGTPGLPRTSIPTDIEDDLYSPPSSPQADAASADGLRPPISAVAIRSWMQSQNDSLDTIPGLDLSTRSLQLSRPATNAITAASLEAPEGPRVTNSTRRSMEDQRMDQLLLELWNSIRVARPETQYYTSSESVSEPTSMDQPLQEIREDVMRSQTTGYTRSQHSRGSVSTGTPAPRGSRLPSLLELELVAQLLQLLDRTRAAGVPIPPISAAELMRITNEEIQRLIHSHGNGDTITQIQPETFASTPPLQLPRDGSIPSRELPFVLNIADAHAPAGQPLDYNLDLDFGTPPLPQTFAGYPALQTLRLNHNPIDQIDARAFAGMPSLTTLTPTPEQIAAVGPQAFTGGPAPRELPRRPLAAIEGAIPYVRAAIPGEVLKTAASIARLSAQYNLLRPRPEVPNGFECIVSANFMSLPVFDATHAGDPERRVTWHHIDASSANGILGPTDTGVLNGEYGIIDPACPSCRHPMQRENLRIDTQLQNAILAYLRTTVNPVQA